ncbi:MAG: YegS/Rv2252/BmrU family lipid kinase [Clostridiales bacterium]|jgi:YegS/Rv2252/BmrU family lipid kinase|nr:YegS/Rv2252/BmrU family lipid kinase [Clostridiales bacterium]
MGQKILLIANPMAGMRKVQRMLPKVIKLFENNGYEVQYYETKSRGDGTDAVIRYADSCDLVVSAGGDGTLNETVTGLMSLDNRPALGYIPAGSTNDFATSLGLPSDIMKAAKNVVEGSPRLLDIGKINERYFSYVASFGAFTDASYSTPQNLKNTLGHLAYVLEGVKELPNIRPRHIKLVSDGEVYEDEWLFGSISNSTSLGGIVRLNAGLVDFSDGLFEVMLIKNPKNAIEVSKILISLQSRKYDEDFITFFRTSDISITTDGETPWSLDGEYYAGSESIAVKNIHHAIRFITRKDEGGG